MNHHDNRTDKGSWAHNYLMIYDRIISNPPDRVLEIGIYQGGSLRVWADEWPDAELHGVDIDAAFIRDDIPANIHLADAYQPSILLEPWALPGFDLIIDDGPHTIESQLFTITKWVTLLRSGGVLVVEDIRDELTLQELASNLPLEMKRRSFGVVLDGCSSQFSDSHWSRMLVVLG
jgi:trans-aconitate methyltransferase